ncbi:fungal-specific transcription factor domain-containing protein [Leptodontidium sp. 2 PMI_412]|nr:fungal-specific transcription factor domain-containing protein [Leptodontidium sp. 2 PMI_412]
MSHTPTPTPTSDPNISRSLRKKTPGACERCREKRIKCDGVQPCDKCSKKGQNCVFALAPLGGTDVLADKLDLVLSRIDRLEQSMKQRSPSGPPYLVRAKSRNPVHAAQSSCLAQLNPQTGCFEHYGRTSTFVVASSLGKRIQQLEACADPAPLRKRLHIGNRMPVGDCIQEVESLDLNDLAGVCDYVLPSNVVLGQHRRLRSDVTDRHVESFFRTIHIFLPIFDVSKFKAKYSALRSIFRDNRLYVLTQGGHNRQQFLCLLYAVLALGALYEDERDDNSSWASWYFAQAQEILGHMLDAVNLELVQAAMLLGAYAQHAIKPSLAYNLAGIATRLAFSIGLNIGSNYGSPAFDAEEARRTWWMIYVQEVELSLDSGRPMSIRTCEMDIGYPSSQVCSAESVDALTEMSLIKAHREELLQWHASLPAHLQFSYEVQGLDSTTKHAPYSWRARQLSSLRIHYNLAMIILLRNFLNKSLAAPSDHSSLHYKQQEDLYKSSCIDAACDMISHIHALFSLAPSLRRWSYYCFYCLQSTLVLLTSMIEEDNGRNASQTAASLPATQDTVSRTETKERGDLLSFCELSMKIFHQIELEAAKRCARVVRKFLDRWESRQRKRKQRNQGKPRPDRTAHKAGERQHIFPDDTNDHLLTAEPNTDVLWEGSSNFATSHFDQLQSWAFDPFTPSNPPDRQGSIYLGTESELNVAEGDGYPITSPSTDSLDRLQAELELCNTWYNGNGFNGRDSSSGIFSNHTATQFGMHLNGSEEFLLHVQRDLVPDESGWLIN